VHGWKVGLLLVGLAGCLEGGCEPTGQLELVVYDESAPGVQGFHNVTHEQAQSLPELMDLLDRSNGTATATLSTSAERAEKVLETIHDWVGEGTEGRYQAGFRYDGKPYRVFEQRRCA